MTAKSVKTKLVPPDGGWGWVVLSSALVVNFLIPGTVKSFGVLFVEFLHVFKASSTAASWMPALCYFLYNSLGPLSSILSSKYSYKTVTIIGGAFAAGGMMSSYFANSVSYLYVSYGLMVGIGAGLTFPPTVYIVTSYFEKLRGFANGLCISGSAIGTIVLPPFLQYLLDCFGYRGAVLIMGALTLNTLVCGLLYHPVEEHMISVPLEKGIDNEALTIDEPGLNQKKQSAIENVSVTTVNEISNSEEELEKKCQDESGADDSKMEQNLENGNEAVEDDKDNSLSIEKDNSLPSDKDNSLSVEKDNSLSIEKDNSFSIEKDNFLSIEKDNSLPIDKDNSLLIDKNNSFAINKDNFLSIEKDDSLPTDKDNSLAINKDNSLPIDKDNSLSIEKDNSLPIDKDNSLLIDKNNSFAINKDNFLSIEKDDSLPTDKDDSLAINKDNFLSIEKDNSLSIEKDNFLSIEKDNSLPIDKDNSLLIDEDNSFAINKDNFLSIEKDDSLPIDKDNSLLIDKDNSLLIDKDNSLAINKDNSLPSDKDNSAPPNKANSLSTKDSPSESPKGSKNLEDVVAHQEITSIAITHPKLKTPTSPPLKNNKHKPPSKKTRKSQRESSEKKESKSKRQFFDLSVLKDPIYLVILISNSTSAISNTNFMILLPSYAISQGFDKNSSALLLSVVSALDLVGRIGGASLSDIDFVPKYYYFVGGLGTSGLALALLPMATSYTMLSFFCALFGLSSGMYIGITTVVLADMIGTEKLSSSYGISLFVNGVLQLIGPPICGVVFESVGTYKPIFLAFGIILILGTALWAALPVINRKNKKNLPIV